MVLHPLPRTSAAVEIARKELSLALKITGIVMQAVTIAFYTVMMVVSYPVTFRMVSYTVLFGISLALFIVGFALGEKKKEWKEDAKKREKKKRRVSLWLKIINYLFRLALIVLALVDILRGESTEFALISTILSSVFFLLGFILELIIQLSNHYLDFFEFAFKRDLEEHRFISGVSEVKHNPLKLVEKFTDALAGNKAEDAATPHEKSLDGKLMQTYESGKDKKREQKALQRVEDKKKRERSKERIKENLRKIKQKFHKEKTDSSGNNAQNSNEI